MIFIQQFKQETLGIYNGNRAGAYNIEPYEATGNIVDANFNVLGWE